MLTQLSYCNTINSISRCTRFRFGPLNPIQILPRLKYVADKEDVKMTEDGEKALITLAQGDMRKVRFKTLSTTFEVLVIILIKYVPNEKTKIFTVFSSGFEHPAKLRNGF